MRSQGSGEAHDSCPVPSVERVDVRHQPSPRLPVVGWRKQDELLLPRRFQSIQYHPRLFVHGVGVPEPLEVGAGVAQQVRRVVGGAGQGDDRRKGVGRGLGAVAVLAEENGQGVGSAALAAQLLRCIRCLHVRVINTLAA